MSEIIKLNVDNELKEFFSLHTNSTIFTFCRDVVRLTSAVELLAICFLYFTIRRRNTFWHRSRNDVKRQSKFATTIIGRKKRFQLESDHMIKREKLSWNRRFRMRAQCSRLRNFNQRVVVFGKAEENMKIASGKFPKICFAKDSKDVFNNRSLLSFDLDSRNNQLNLMIVTCVISWLIKFFQIWNPKTELNLSALADCYHFTTISCQFMKLFSNSK